MIFNVRTSVIHEVITLVHYGKYNFVPIQAFIDSLPYISYIPTLEFVFYQR